MISELDTRRESISKISFLLAHKNLDLFTLMLLVLISTMQDIVTKIIDAMEGDFTEDAFFEEICKFPESVNYGYAICQESVVNGLAITCYKIINNELVKDGPELHVNYLSNNYDNVGRELLIGNKQQTVLISSFCVYNEGMTVGTDLREEIYSNRTDFFINGIYQEHSSDFFSDKYREEISIIHKQIFDDNMYLWLLDLITSGDLSFQVRVIYPLNALRKDKDSNAFV